MKSGDGRKKTMNRVELKKVKSLKGEITPPPDKSISHRAVMFASIAEGKSIVRNFLWAEDPINTMNAMRMLGVEIEQPSAISHQPSAIVIHGQGLHGLREPFDVINCGNSGTTMRLISGILAGNPFFTVLTGDDSLKQRPMARVINPLQEMGADIFARNNDKYPPIAIKGGGVKGITCKMPIASAQVKSCLILAGLYADGTTIITEPQKSRDHTERMLKAMGADIEVDGLTIKVRGQRSEVRGQELNPLDITIPADFSSAAFFIVAALMVPDSEVLIKGVGINPTRTGLLDVIKDMGGNLRIENIRDVSGEPVADIYCRTASSLKAVKIGADIMPSLIDEFPILCVLAAQADGISEIRGAEELRVKESDRIKVMAEGLRRIGVEVEELPDGMVIHGTTHLKGATIESHGDHRVAMAFSIAGLLSEDRITIKDTACIDTSFPEFFNYIERLID